MTAPMSPWLRSCGSKRRYRSEGKALQVASLCVKDRGGSLRAYHCSLCFGWHLTRKPLAENRIAAPVERVSV